MKVFFFETTNASPHLETSLELAKRHIDRGDEVHYYFLGHSVPYAEFVQKKQIVLFGGCLPERKGAKLIGEKLNFHQPYINCSDLRSSFDGVFYHDIKLFKYKSYNAGISAYSSLISHLKQSNPDPVIHKNLIYKILVSGAAIYEFVLSVISSNKPDLMYLFNGRFAVNRAILDAAIEAKIPYLIHERGANKYRYIARPFMPHDIDRVQDLMINAWREGGNVLSEKVANDFFYNQRRGVAQGWNSFITRQSESLLPDFLPQDETNIIAYFSSSDDEYAAVGDIVEWDRWPNQISAVKDLIAVVSKYPELFLVIRLHPHKSEKHPSDLKVWLELPLPSNIKLILPDDPVDTYALIERANVVVTSGSTVGIESVFWGTPSICLGPSLYDRIDAVYLPANCEALERLLLGRSLVANPKNSLCYGYFMATFGEEYMFYNPETLFSGEFLGVDLNASGACGFLRMLSKLLAQLVRKVYFIY